MGQSQCHGAGATRRGHCNLKRARARHPAYFDAPTAAATNYIPDTHKHKYHAATHTCNPIDDISQWQHRTCSILHAHSPPVRPARPQAKPHWRELLAVAAALQPARRRPTLAQYGRAPLSRGPLEVPHSHGTGHQSQRPSTEIIALPPPLLIQLLCRTSLSTTNHATASHTEHCQTIASPCSPPLPRTAVNIWVTGLLTATARQHHLWCPL
jgi:hypothetical protein